LTSGNWVVYNGFKWLKVGISGREKWIKLPKRG